MQIIAFEMLSYARHVTILESSLGQSCSNVEKYSKCNYVFAWALPAPTPSFCDHNALQLL